MQAIGTVESSVGDVDDLVAAIAVGRSQSPDQGAGFAEASLLSGRFRPRPAALHRSGRDRRGRGAGRRTRCCGSRRRCWASTSAEHGRTAERMGIANLDRNGLLELVGANDLMAAEMPAIDWPKLVIGMLGGDKREQEIARRAAATGAEVRAHGFPWPEQGIPGVQHLDDPAAVLKGARFALFPIPGISASGALFAPAAPAPIVPDRAMLAGMAPRAHIILGWADKNLKAHAEALSIKLHEYEWDRSLMLQRTPAIIEGLLKIVIENTAITIHNSPMPASSGKAPSARCWRAISWRSARTPMSRRAIPSSARLLMSPARRRITLEELPALAPRSRFHLLHGTDPRGRRGRAIAAAEIGARRRSGGAARRRRFRRSQAARPEGDLGTRARQPRARHRRRQPMGWHPRADRE